MVLADSEGRATLARALALVAITLLAAPLGWGYGFLFGGLGAVLLALDVTRRLEPVRRRIARLAEEARGGPEATGTPQDLEGLAARVDVARTSLAEARRKAEHERDDLLGILTATSEGILVIGSHHRIEMLNDAARRILAPTVDPLGHTLPEVVRHGALVEFVGELLRGMRPRRRTLELFEQDERLRVDVSGTLVRERGKRQRAVVVLRDLSEVAHLESVRTDFIANVTHEMRSPLSSILGYAETLATETGLTPDMQDFLERILRNARRLDDIIRDLIDLSRLEHATAPEIQHCDVAGLLEDVASGQRDTARDRGLALEVDAESLDTRLPVDPALLKQALTNLLDNALKYTPAGGRVRMSATTSSDGSELVLEVVDSGRGIPRDHQARIFERFYRVDTARSRSIGGTGLGLAIVKHATALHDGHVELESSPQGSTFRIRVPLHPGGPAA